jgi:hypothetical protein
MQHRRVLHLLLPVALALGPGCAPSSGKPAGAGGGAGGTPGGSAPTAGGPLERGKGSAAFSGVMIWDASHDQNSVENGVTCGAFVKGLPR